MRPLAIRLFRFAICAAVMVPLIAAAEGAASRRHPRKHHHYRPVPGFKESWSTRGVPVPSSWGGDVCPGIGRSFECKIWPPPFDQDPDRKVSGSDAGG